MNVGARNGLFALGIGGIDTKPTFTLALSGCRTGERACGSTHLRQARYMNIQGGARRIGAENGLLCTACHTHHNAALRHGPPGAHVWLLAPVAMQR
jgi:hypothetical protein